MFKQIISRISDDIIDLDLKQAGKWFFYSILVGIISGLGAILFHVACQGGLFVFLGLICGYYPSEPGGEPAIFHAINNEFIRWFLIFVPAIGGLLSGILIYTYAPEAQGHGTDAAIDAYHNKRGYIKPIIPLIKTVASALTIGSGGSGGREGPIAQIGAGFGSFLATKLKLSEKNRRILLVAGLGAGVGSIFRAPLAGSLFAVEVLYRDLEFEYEAIFPVTISSIVAYSIFAMQFGWHSLFITPDFEFSNPAELLPYTVLAVVVAFFAITYVKIFYGFTHYFAKLRIKNHFKPAIGGLMVGAIGFFVPETLAFSYGIIQDALDGNVALTLLLVVGLGKILTTSFTIGSGGSGGVFGPSMVIGGCLGGLVGILFNKIGLVAQPGAFVIVGMAGFFAGAANTPISTLFMVSEMTGNYHLIVPSMWVCTISYLLCGKWSIYEKQVQNRISSPVHRGDFAVDILKQIRVKDVMKDQKIVTIKNNTRFQEILDIITHSQFHYFPVEDEFGKVKGVISFHDIQENMFDKELNDYIVADDLTRENIIYALPEDNLNSTLEKFIKNEMDSLPVVDSLSNMKLKGMISRKEIFASYYEKLME